MSSSTAFQRLFSLFALGPDNTDQSQLPGALLFHRVLLLRVTFRSCGVACRFAREVYQIHCLRQNALLKSCVRQLEKNARSLPNQITQQAGIPTAIGLLTGSINRCLDCYISKFLEKTFSKHQIMREDHQKQVCFPSAKTETRDCGGLTVSRRISVS